jgi:hypothetical protein
MFVWISVVYLEGIQLSFCAFLIFTASCWLFYIAETCSGVFTIATIKVVHWLVVFPSLCILQAQLVPSWRCSQAVRKPVWHISLLFIQWKTPDDGQRNCPKHVEFYSKNKFEKLVHLVGFIIRSWSRCMVTWTSNSAGFATPLKKIFQILLQTQITDSFFHMIGGESHYGQLCAFAFSIAFFAQSSVSCPTASKGIPHFQWNP